MLVDEKVTKKLLSKYLFKQNAGPVERRGILHGDEGWKEGFVELYLKKFDIMAFPNKKMFDFKEPQSIYVSKVSTVKDLNLKVRRCLNMFEDVRSLSKHF